MSAQWDGKMVMSTPGGPVIEMSLGEYIAWKDAEIERLTRERYAAWAEVERLRAEMLELAEWCEAEEPLSHKKLSYRLRYAQEAKP